MDVTIEPMSWGTCYICKSNIDDNGGAILRFCEKNREELVAIVCPVCMKVLWGR